MKSDKMTDVANTTPTKTPIPSENEKGVGEKMDTTGPLTPDQDQMKKKEDVGPKKNAKEEVWQEILTKAQKKENQKQAKAQIVEEKAQTAETPKLVNGERLFAKRKDLEGFKILLTLCRNHRRYGTTAWSCNDACLFREFKNFKFLTESEQLKICTHHTKYDMESNTCAKGCWLSMPGALQKHIAKTIKAKKCYYHVKFGINAFKCVGWCGMKNHLKQKEKKDDNNPSTKAKIDKGRTTSDNA